MKLMKRLLIILLTTVLAVVLLIVIAIAALLIFPKMKNEHILSNKVDDFTDIVSQYATDPIVETKSTYGKLNGCGNGIDFFGAVLVKKDAVPDMDALLARLKESFYVVEVLDQTDKHIVTKHLEHEKLNYDTAISEADGYITICFLTSDPNASLLDIAGH